MGELAQSVRHPLTDTNTVVGIDSNQRTSNESCSGADAKTSSLSENTRALYIMLHS